MKKTFWTILILLTIGAIMFGVFKYILPLGSDSNKTTFTENLGKDAENLVIDASLLDMTIKTGNEFIVDYIGSERLKPTAEYDSSSKTITVKQPDSVKNKNTKENNKLTITIPEGAKLNRFEVNLNLGNVDMGHIAAETIEINDNLGNVTADSAKAGKITVVANLGDIKLKGVDCADIDITADLGVVKIETTSGVSDYTINADASLGKVSVDGKSQGSSFSQQGSSGKIKIACSLGDVSIK